jgi:hypothetical protein
MKRSLFVILSIIISFSAGKGQDVSVKTAFDTSRIFIGDQIHFTITIDQPSDLRLNLIPLEDTLFRNIEILSGPVSDTFPADNNRLRIVNKYLITSFDSGFYQVPPVYAEMQVENGLKRFYSDYSLLEVMRVKIAPADTASAIFDIIEPFRAPLTIGEIIPWLLLAAVATVLVWGIIRLVRRFIKAKKEPEPVKNPDPAHVIAFRDLEKLREQKLWQKGEVKQYYSRLTEILRQYLENRYGVFSLELTTSETLEELLKTGFRKDDNFVKLKTILTGSDLVKFARYKPDPSENEMHFENSWEFVNITRIRDEVKESVTTNSTKETER